MMWAIILFAVTYVLMLLFNKHRSALFRIALRCNSWGHRTPIAASANIAGIGILRKEGYTAKKFRFL